MDGGSVTSPPESTLGLQLIGLPLLGSRTLEFKTLSGDERQICPLISALIGLGAVAEVTALMRGEGFGGPTGQTHQVSPCHLRNGA
jgi:hypothetical protein